MRDETSLPAAAATGSAGEENRRGFLRSAAGLAGASGVVLGGASVTQAATSRRFLPDLYPGSNGRNFRQIMADENAHVAFLVQALGAAARPRPNFNMAAIVQPNVRTFVETSFALENTGVDAYLGAAPLIFEKAYLAAAGSILTIEARHSGYLGALTNQTTDLFQKSFDNPTGQEIPVQNASPFIVDLNGGEPLGYDPHTSSPANDLRILNTALALEYLEQLFYNINVPRFFR